MSRKRLGIVLALGWLAVFGLPLVKLIVFSFNSDVYTHIMLIPVVSAYLIWTNRKEIFSGQTGTWSNTAKALLSVGVLGYALSLGSGKMATSADGLFICTLTALFVFWGLFLGYFGRQAFIAALFPLLFLLFMVPLPALVLDGLVRFLQTASAQTSALVFDFFNIPFLRDGAVFALPGLSIEVAPECSGIRSGFALTVISMLASYMFLESKWRRGIFMAAVLPVTIFKNALRIVMLGYLGAFVDQGFITDSLLHKQGGRPFLFIAVLILLPLLWVLRRSEKRSEILKRRSSKGTPDINSSAMNPVSKKASSIATVMNR